MVAEIRTVAYFNGLKSNGEVQQRKLSHVSRRLATITAVGLGWTIAAEAATALYVMNGPREIGTTPSPLLSGFVLMGIPSFFVGFATAMGLITNEIQRAVLQGKMKGYNESIAAFEEAPLQEYA